MATWLNSVAYKWGQAKPSQHALVAEQKKNTARKRREERAREMEREGEEGETEIKLTSEACNVVLLVLH